MTGQRWMTMFWLLLLLAFFMTVPELGKHTSAEETVCAIQAADGTVFLYEADGQGIAVTVPSAGGRIEVNVCEADAPSVVYSFYTDAAVTAGRDGEVSVDWARITELCSDGHASARKIKFDGKEASLDRSDHPGGAIGRDLQEGLQALHGSEYAGVEQYSAVLNGQDLRVYERMDFQIYGDCLRKWDTGEDLLTLGCFAAASLQKTVSLGMLPAMGLYTEELSVMEPVIPGSGQLYQYRCLAYIGRYTSVNGSAYAYTRTDLIHSYIGYDDNDLNSTARACVDPSSHTWYYTDDEDYYQDCAAQAVSAYKAFARLGQKA